MDRRAALDILELVRPDANDLRHPDFAEALAYLETDELAREEFARHQEQDRQIAQAMNAVPVPNELKTRLQSLMANEDEAKAVVSGEAVPSRIRRKLRWVLSASIVMAGCLLAGLGFWFFGESSRTLIALQELEIQAPFEEPDIAKLAPFSGNFDPVKPEGLWMSENRFRFSSPPKGFEPNWAGSDRVAVYEFTFRDPQHRQRGELRGVMLVVPQSELAERPESQSFLDGAYTTHQAKPNVAIRSWAEGEFVYVCLVPIQHFEALARVFDAPAA